MLSLKLASLLLTLAFCSVVLSGPTAQEQNGLDVSDYGVRTNAADGKYWCLDLFTVDIFIVAQANAAVFQLCGGLSFHSTPK